MADINRILEKLLNSGAAGGFAGALAGGLATNALTGKKGKKRKKGKKAKKMAKNALKLGGIAAVGALAYTAYQRYSQKDNVQPQAVPPLPPPPAGELMPAPPGPPFLPDTGDEEASEVLGLTLVRAMIAAARSDGRLDAEESQAIFQRIESLELDSENQALLVEEMGHPVDMDSIVNSANCPEIAAEIYVASLLAIEVDTAAESAYMAMLAARLRLPSDLVAELEREVAAQKVIV